MSHIPVKSRIAGNDVNKSSEEDQAKKQKFNLKLELVAPKVLTENTYLWEVQERETLWREFLVLHEKIKDEEISIPLLLMIVGVVNTPI